MTDRIDERMIDAFRWLHRHPETAFEEIKTTAFIKDFLRQNDIELLDFPLETGALAIIRGGGKGPVIALRADIDGLSIQETAGHALCSAHPGMMHACGHDFHTASLLGAALLLKERAEQLNGTVLLLFQPAEENFQGAQRVLDTGLLSDVEMIFAMHVKADGDAGTVYAKYGPEHAAVDRFAVRLKAADGHAAAPHTTADVVVATAALVQALQTIVSRNVDPVEPSVLSVTRIGAGNAWNVLPETSEMEGTARSFSADVRKLMKERFYAVVAGVSATYGVEWDIQWVDGIPATNNDYVPTEMIKKIAAELGMQVRPAIPSMGGEDFACYQRKIIGVMWEFGIASPYPLHNAAFYADPALLPKSARLMAEVAATALK